MKYKQVSQNEWLIEVRENGKTKELFIEFPDGCLDQVGWDVGDNLIWDELPDGSWRQRKDDGDGNKENRMITSSLSWYHIRWARQRILFSKKDLIMYKT